MIAIYLIVILIMLVLSALFSGTEAVFNSANTMHLRRNAENGSKTAKLAYKISENFYQEIIYDLEHKEETK